MQKGDPRQKFAEGKSVEQFAEVVHSNPEKAKQRQLSQNFGGVGFHDRQNFAEPKGKAIDQFAAFVFI